MKAADNCIWGAVFLIRIMGPSVAVAPVEEKWDFICLERSECCYSSGLTLFVAVYNYVSMYIFEKTFSLF